MELDLKTLEEHQLSPDEFVFLFLLVYPQAQFPTFGVIDYTKLERKGMIKIGPDDTYYVRQLAIDIVKVPTVISDFEEPVAKPSPVISKEVDKVPEWIADWRSLFPMGVKTGGYSVRGTRGGCTKKMKKFMRNNPDVTKEQVFAATKQYIADKQAVHFQYMKLADYFIEKEGASLLEEYVETIKQGKTHKQEQLFAPGVSDPTGNLTDDI